MCQRHETYQSAMASIRFSTQRPHDPLDSKSEDSQDCGYRRKGDQRRKDETSWNICLQD